MPPSSPFASPWWVPVAFVAVAGHLTNICVSLFLHRSQTHRGLQLHPAVALPMRFWLWLTTGIVTKHWVACHRKHHAFADREGDPHSPVLEGVTRILFGGYFYYAKAVTDRQVVERYGKGTPDDWLERNLFSRFNWAGLILLLATDLLLFGWLVGAVVWTAQTLWIPVLSGGVVNGLGHAMGYINFKLRDASRNLFPVGIILLGEELHNNHHADPRSARFAVRWFEVDIGWVYIRILAALRLARVEYARIGRGRRPAASTVRAGMKWAAQDSNL